MPRKPATDYEVDQTTSITLRPCIHQALESVHEDAKHTLKRAVTRREIVERALIEGLKRIRVNWNLPFDEDLRDMHPLAELVRRRSVRWVKVEKKEGAK